MFYFKITEECFDFFVKSDTNQAQCLNIEISSEKIQGFVQP